MYLEAGSGFDVGAAAAWDGLADELAVAASVWVGDPGLRMRAGAPARLRWRAVAPYLGWLDGQRPS